MSAPRAAPLGALRCRGSAWLSRRRRPCCRGRPRAASRRTQCRRRRPCGASPCASRSETRHHRPRRPRRRRPRARAPPARPRPRAHRATGRCHPRTFPPAARPPGEASHPRARLRPVAPPHSLVRARRVSSREAHRFRAGTTALPGTSTSPGGVRIPAGPRAGKVGEGKAAAAAHPRRAPQHAGELCATHAARPALRGTEPADVKTKAFFLILHAPYKSRVSLCFYREGLFIYIFFFRARNTRFFGGEARLQPWRLPWVPHSKKDSKQSCIRIVNSNGFHIARARAERGGGCGGGCRLSFAVRRFQGS